MRMVFWNEVKAEKALSGEDVPVQPEGTDGNGTGLAVEKGELSNAAMTVPELNPSKEFYDLWHSLKVPNEVDLLKQLQNGISLSSCPSFRFAIYCIAKHYYLFICRGLASHSSRGTCGQGTNGQEEGTEVWAKTKTSSVDEYQFERTNRLEQGLCCCWQVIHDVDCPALELFILYIRERHCLWL